MTDRLEAIREASGQYVSSVSRPDADWLLSVVEAADELAKAAEEAERAPYPDQQEEAQRKLVEKLAAYRRIREGEGKT